jgi:transketolase
MAISQFNIIHKAKLAKEANLIRRSIISMLNKAGSGHVAGALGMADIFTYLYFHALRHDPKKPDWDLRDRLVVSNGHICPVYYATLAHAGYFPKEELMTLRQYGSRLQGHPHREWFPFSETSSGPLGSGLSQAAGMALADKIDEGRTGSRYFYCILSDGEHDEGQLWEAALFAAKERLGSLIAIVDRNNIQIGGYTEDVMPLEPLAEKWRAFGWHVREIDGHNFSDIHSAVGECQNIFDRPSVIIAHTIPGKGVSFMERDYRWHGKVPSEAETNKALVELEKAWPEAEGMSSSSKNK